MALHAPASDPTSSSVCPLGQPCVQVGPATLSEAQLRSAFEGSGLFSIVDLQEAIDPVSVWARAQIWARVGVRGSGLGLGIRTRCALASMRGSPYAALPVSSLCVECVPYHPSLLAIPCAPSMLLTGALRRHTRLQYLTQDAASLGDAVG